MRDGSTPFWTTAASARLLIERYRAAAALVEHDSDLLSKAGTVSAVQALREDIEKHVNRSGHDPLVEAIRALSSTVARENGGEGKDES